jgi:hypothetical protein
VNNDLNNCSAVVTYIVTYADNCPNPVLTQTAGLASGSAFPVGTTTNTFKVTDGSGNTATCSFNVTSSAGYCFEAWHPTDGTFHDQNPYTVRVTAPLSCSGR